MDDAPPKRAASRTALAVALARAAHHAFDEPAILADPLAERLLGDGALEPFRSEPALLDDPDFRYLRTHVAHRSRYAEERFAAAFARGVRQHVVLGAGLDTFAFRQPAWAHEARFFEADHPTSQADKFARLARGGVPVPPNVTFAPIDFEETPLAEGLAEAGFDRTRTAFFSWLGVTMYLRLEAVDAVFAYVASLPPQSEIAFTFARPQTPENASALAERARAAGEPWLTGFEPEEIEARLRGFGFREVDFLRANLGLGHRVSIAHAIV